MEAWNRRYSVKFSYIPFKAAEVNETGVRKVSRLLVINTEKEVQGESGDHGGKELHREKKNVQNQ